MTSQLTDAGSRATMGEKMTVPAPYDFELKSDFLGRVAANKPLARAYPTPIKRRLAGERRWAQAKRDSLVSITTATGEVLLFGRLD